MNTSSTNLKLSPRTWCVCPLSTKQQNWSDIQVWQLIQTWNLNPDPTVIPPTLWGLSLINLLMIWNCFEERAERLRLHHRQSDVWWGTLLAGDLVETQVSSRCSCHQKSADTDKGILSVCISPLATTSPTDWLNRFMGCVRKGFRLISGICVGLQFDKMLSNLKPYSRFVCLSKVRSSLLQI